MTTRRPRRAAGRARALGLPTRGTTHPNRLRRNDIFLCTDPVVGAALRADPAPLVIDLGYGSSGVTTVELAARLRPAHPDVRVLGLEIDPERVAAAQPLADPPSVDFAVGGFELAGHHPNVVRAMNVLRQYTEEQADDAWRQLTGRLAPGGVAVEGTCNELGRIGSWVVLDADGPISLTLSCAPDLLDRPATLAERLPKALIHHNVDGEPVHRLLGDLDRAWATAAPLSVFSAAQRWCAAAEALAAAGWPVRSTRRAHRRGELTVAATAIWP